MTTQYVDLETVSGLSLTESLFAVDGDTVLYTADSVTERTNAKGVYRASYGETSAITGTYRAIAFLGSNPVASGIRVFSGVDTEVAMPQIDTVLARIGAWTGTGINTILGAFRALAAKASSLTPTDLSTGTTFDNTTDSIEAIRDRGDAAWTTGSSGGSGSGARTVTVTVNDGTTALQNATVRMTEGANSFTALTNVSGVATFNLDDATYVVSITKSGYSYAGTTLIVNGAETVTYSMTQIVVTPPTDPTLCAVTFHARDQYGVDAVGEPVEITFVRWSEAATYTPPVVSIPPVQETDAGGLVEVELYRNATYKIVYGGAAYARRIDVNIPDASSFEVEI